MVSDSIDNYNLTQSLHVGTANSGAKHRKRHKSAGDNLQTKFRSNSLFANFRLRHLSEDDKLGMKFSDLIAKEHKADDAFFDARETAEDKNTVSEMQDISEEIKDSGVALDENEINCISEENGHLGSEIENVNVGEEKEIDTAVDVNSVDSNDLTSNEIRSDNVPESGDTAVEMRTNEIRRNVRNFKSYSSPLQSTPTPVTENDPLGLFIEPISEKADRTAKIESPDTSPQKNREKFVASRPFANFDLGENSEINEGQGKCNTENSSGNAELNKGGLSTSVVNSPVDKVQRSLFKIERTFSFPEELGHGGKGQPFKTNRSGSEQTDQGALIHSSTSLNDSIKSDSSAKAEFRLFRTGSFRRHKDNFSGMLRFATGAVANKLSEIKLSMTPSKLGSKDSLTPSIDELDSGNGEEDQYRESQKKFGSADYLKRSNDTLDSAGHTNGSLPLPG